MFQKALQNQASDEIVVSELKQNLTTNNAISYTGSPFSGIVSSMVPQDIIAKLENELNSESNGQPDFTYDEFGFRVEEEDASEKSSNKLLSTPFIEREAHRLKWIAFLEFSHNKEASELTWSTIDVVLPRTEKLRNMIINEGIPHSLRNQLWLRLSLALQKKINSEMSYEDILKAANNDSLMTSKQIERDLLRILPTNACFRTLSGTGVSRLRRVLRALAWLYTDIGYCQGTGVIVASLLLIMEEENVFWMMTAIIEDILPTSYYSSNLIGVQADQKVLQTLIANYLIGVDQILKSHDIELSLITLQWFLTIFSNVIHMKILLRLVI